MLSVFSRIVRGEIPSYKIAENNYCFAFLDISPLAKGHTLVIPKVEVDYIFDLEDNLIAELHVFSKHIAIAMQKAVPCIRIGMAVVGMEIPHAHIHLIPINRISDMDFSRTKLVIPGNEMAAIQNAIINNL